MSQERSIHWVEAFALSAAVHVGAVFVVADFLRDIQLFPEAQEEQVDILVTSLVFDTNSLSDIPPAPETAGTEGRGEDPDALDPAEADSLDPVEPPRDTLAAAEPEPEPLPELETLEPAEPEVPETETPEPVEAETVTAEEVAPEAPTTEPVTPEAETLSAVAPPAAPEPLSPLRPDEDSVAAMVPQDNSTTLSGVATLAAPVSERLTAVAPTAPSASVAPSTAAVTTTVAPVVNHRPEVSPPAPPRPAVEPPAPGSPAAIVQELVSKIRASVADPCLVAMPQQASDGAPELVMLASDETSVTSFAANVLEDIDPRPAQRGVLIDARQCAAVTYLRENPSYPAFRLTLRLGSDVVISGEDLSGAVGRAAGRYVSLLLVDDNGVVQDLTSYLRFAGGEARFSAPVRRAGPNRDTSQMLIALATSNRPRTLDTDIGKLAENFFPALRAEIGASVPLVMVPFDVR